MTGIEKSQTILQTEEGASRGVERISIYESSAKEKGFKNELLYYGVKDIFTETQIKRDGDNYIFFIDNQVKFFVDKNIFVNFIQRFYQEQKKDETEEAQETILIRLKEIQGEQTLEYIKGELDILKQDIENNLNKPEEATDIITTKYIIERLITFFQQEKSLTNQRTGKIFDQEYKRTDKGLRKIQKTEIEKRINELEAIKKQIERLQKNKDKKYQIKRDEGNGEFKDVVMDDINGYDANITLAQFNERIEELGKEVPDFIKQRNDILLGKADMTPGYTIKINTVEDAIRIQKALKKENEEYQILNSISLETAKQKELNEDLKTFDGYLTAIIQDPDNFRPTELQFKPTHAAEFNELRKNDPTLKKYYNENKVATSTDQENYRNGTSTTSQDNKGDRFNNDATNNPTTREVATSSGIIDPSMTGYKDAMEKYGIRGAIYNTFNYFPNMKTEQKSFWTNALFLGGMGFVLWKAGKRFFTGAKNEKGEKVGPGFRGRLAIVGGTVLGTNMLTGKSPIELINKAVNGGFKFDDIKNIFSQQSQEASEDAQTYVVAPLTTTLLLGNQKIGELNNTIDPKNFTLREYDNLLQTAIQTKNTDRQKLLEAINKNPTSLATGFRQMGITPENISTMDQNMTVDEYFARYMHNMQTAETYRLKNKFKVVNGKEKELEKLITSGKELTKADLERAQNELGIYELENALDSEEVKQAKDALHQQIDGLQNITVDKQEIKDGMDLFYDTMPLDKNNNKNIKITQSGDKSYIESYGEKTQLDFNKKILKGFKNPNGQEYIFTTYTEAIAAANLTNRLREIFKDNEAQNADEPFHVDVATGNIEFDNTKRYEIWRKELTAISSGWFTSKLDDISETLDNHRDDYCRYLNSQKFRKMTPSQ